MIYPKHPIYTPVPFIAWVDVAEGLGTLANPQRIVVTFGGVGDWAAYQGPLAMDPSKIAQIGSKIMKEDAVKLFPVFAAEQYRI